MDKETIIRKGITVGDYITITCKGAKVYTGTFTASDDAAVRLLSAKVLRVPYADIINIEKSGVDEMFHNEDYRLLFKDEWTVDGKADSREFWNVWNKYKDNVAGIIIYDKVGKQHSLTTLTSSDVEPDGEDWVVANNQDIYIGSIYKIELFYKNNSGENSEVQEELHLSDVSLTISMREFIQGDEMFYDGFWAMMNALSLTEEYIYEIHFRYSDEVILVKELEMSPISKYFKYNGKSYELMQVSKIYVCKGSVGEVQKEEASDFLNAMSLMGMKGREMTR